MVVWSLTACVGQGCKAQLVECRVWCGADAGLTSPFGKGFFSQCYLSLHTLTVFVQPPIAITCVNIRGHRSKTHKRWRECFLIRLNRTKHARSRGSPLFQATNNIKTEKQTINSTYLVSVGCGRLVGNLWAHYKGPRHWQPHQYFDTQQYSTYQVNPGRRNVAAQVIFA